MSRIGPYPSLRSPLRPTASAPPTVPDGGIATHCPTAASASSRSATSVPAPQHTVISSPRSQSIPVGGRTTRTPATGPPRVAAPVIVTSPLAPTSSANPLRSTLSDPGAGGDRLHVGAPCRAREHLARVGALVGVERPTQGRLGVEVDRTEHQ